MADSENLVFEKSEDEGDVVGNPGLADAMRKVLRMGKNMNKSTLVLAKAKTIAGPKPKTIDPGFEIVKDPTKNSDEAAAKEEPLLDIKPVITHIKKKRIKKAESTAIGRLKPSPLDRQKERPLSKIATQGVVQLFNAVRDQQKSLAKKLEEEGKTEVKRDKVLKSVNKRTFLDVLRGHAEPKTTPNEIEVKTEDELDDSKNEQPSWGVLREDFMMGAKLKDWDKVESNEVEEVQPKRTKVKDKT